MAGKKSQLEDEKLTADIRLYVDPRLKDMAGDAADKAGLPLSEFVARILADHLGHPELGEIPRKSIGRPRNRAVNGKALAGAK